MKIPYFPDYDPDEGHHEGDQDSDDPTPPIPDTDDPTPPPPDGNDPYPWDELVKSPVFYWTVGTIIGLASLTLLGFCSFHAVMGRRQRGTSTENIQQEQRTVDNFNQIRPYVMAIHVDPASIPLNSRCLSVDASQASAPPRFEFI